MTIEELRRAILSEVLVSGRVVRARIPEGMRQGARDYFLCPANLADEHGGVAA